MNLKTRLVRIEGDLINQISAQRSSETRQLIDSATDEEFLELRGIIRKLFGPEYHDGERKPRFDNLTEHDRRRYREIMEILIERRGVGKSTAFDNILDLP